MSDEPLSRILQLSVSERIQLVEDIWDSIAAEKADVPLTDEQMEELDRRIAAAEASPGSGRTWADIKARLLSSR